MSTLQRYLAAPPRYQERSEPKLGALGGWERAGLAGSVQLVLEASQLACAYSAYYRNICACIYRLVFVMHQCFVTGPIA